METIYQHTQIAYPIIIILAAVILLLVPLFLFSTFVLHRLNWIIIILIAPLVIALGLFITMTVSLTNDALKISFGPGVIQKTFNLNEVVNCQAVKNPWQYGWGIHKIPGGWIYNVSGFDAIEIEMASGKKYRIGTDEPEKLLNAICGKKN